MALIEWDSSERQQQLLELLQKDGSEIPNNFVFETAIRYSIDQRYPVSRRRYFSTKTDLSTTPTYAFILEEDTFSSIHIRPPSLGHDLDLLHSLMVELIEMFRHRIDNDGKMLMMSDAHTLKVFHDVVSAHFPAIVVCSPSSPVELFYMTDEQMRAASETELPSIDGFHVDSVDVDRDARMIHDNWVHSSSLQSTTARLRHLPASIVRSSTGEVCAWMMSSPYGQCSNLFTIPTYRGKGLARLAELHLMKQFISQGLRPFKYIDEDNSEVAAARRNSLWTQWDRRREADIGLVESGTSPLFYTTMKRK